MTTTEMDREEEYIMTGGSIPIFSGMRVDYESWKEDIGDWQTACKLKKEVQVARMLIVQPEMVKEVMRQIPKDQRDSAEGFQKVMNVMDQQFKKEVENMSWPAFEKWDNMRRKKGQSTESFIMEYELAFTKARKHDPELQCSDRMLAMKALARLQVDSDHSAQIISNIKGPMTTRSIVSTVETLYRKKDVPWSDQDQPKNKKTTDTQGSEDDTGFVGTEDMVQDAEGAFWVFKGKGASPGKNQKQFTREYKGPSNTKKCERCLQSGHSAGECWVPWSECQKKKGIQPSNEAATGMFVAVMCEECNHPDCDGPECEGTDCGRWEYASASEIDSVNSDGDDQS